MGNCSNPLLTLFQLMTEKDKERFQVMPEQDKLRIAQGATGRVTKRKQVKDPIAPKRAVSAYLWYALTVKSIESN